MRITIKYLLLIVLIFCFSCEKQVLSVNCSDCTSGEPLNANMKIKIDIYKGVSAPVINIYEGNLEDSILYQTYKPIDAETSVTVTLNKKYTATVSYFISNKQYIAIDSATPGVVYNKDQCDNPCYYIYNNVLDLRLKYTK